MQAPSSRVDDPARRGAPGHRRARSPIATLLLSHGAGNGIEARDLRRWPGACRGNGISVVLFEQPWRVAGRKVATRRPPSTPAWRRPSTRSGSGPRSSSAAARPAPARPPGARTRPRCGRLPGAVVPAAPAGPAGEVPARRAARRRGADPGRAGREATPFGASRGVPRPDDSTWPWSRTPTTASRCRSGAAITQDEAMDIVVEATLEWIVREIVGE